MGIVHHAKYLEYFESGRVEYIHRRGVEYLEWTKRGSHLPLSRRIPLPKERCASTNAS